MQAQSGLFFPAKRYSNSGQPIAIARRNTLFKNRIVLGNWLFYLLSLRTGSVRGGAGGNRTRYADKLIRSWALNGRAKTSQAVLRDRQALLDAGQALGGHLY